jgi:hypothetical protein
VTVDQTSPEPRRQPGNASRATRTREQGSTNGPPDPDARPADTETDISDADNADDEGGAAINDTEARYGEDESPA